MNRDKKKKAVTIIIFQQHTTKILLIPHTYGPMVWWRDSGFDMHAESTWGKGLK